MKAVGFNHPLPITQTESLQDIELPVPEYGEQDLLVEVQAIAVNPADTKVRANATPPAGSWRILGWDAVGVVKAVGAQVKGFCTGDRVYYAGAIDRPGCYAQWQAVDARIAAHAPATLDDEAAATLPLTAITAWETLFERLCVGQAVAGAAPAIVIIGGAGGVGSIAIQLARALTDLVVIATASRPQSIEWVKQMGAHHVLDHRQALAPQIAALGLGAPAFVFSTTHTDRYLTDITDFIAAQGRIALIDDPQTLDIVPLKRKSLSVHWEFMFTRPLLQTADMARQQDILRQVAHLAEQGKIISTRTRSLGTINAANLRQAHALLESGQAIGKITLSGF
ncbi:Zn-dependent oxidoreductase [Neisseria dentiae]|uniref:Zinc-type alcohol dehydrogenase-like protein n=1 Tax=Neisseria dentiae TaxID=194197 RepID=A0A1X3D499_9NEIS|nr:zinc-binding alcohol dehydrogenase family protein [Neisseria dentiae]OSI14730.1 Zn-dependent oxidoreductase [Neisseria dentiae]QMT44288.1 zinc-binding alcohol dehydrogenase family protein [Neisseria dentiae]STZ49969.1 zinc-binding alcohol dehydrogenase family protein [Neisseria dentiae]